jgi:hypothetical protein
VIMHTAVRRLPHSVHVVLAAFASTLVAAGGCRSATQPTPAPTEVNANISGAWNGTASDSTGPGQLTWSVTQDGTSFTGTLMIVDSGTNVSGRGSVSGTISGTAVHFSMSVSAASFDRPYEECSASLSGDAQVSGSSLSGTYSGVNSCTGTVTGGQITMSRS